MRWFKPESGDSRIIKRFLFFPCGVSWDREFRWLETAYIYQHYNYNKWINKTFTTKDEYIKYKGEKSLNESRNN